MSQGITENNEQLISKAKLMIQMGNSKLTKLKKEMGSIRKQQKIIEEKKSRLIDKAAKTSTSSTSGKTSSLMSHSSKGDESKIKMSTIKAHSSISDKLQKRKSKTSEVTETERKKKQSIIKYRFTHL